MRKEDGMKKLIFTIPIILIIISAIVLFRPAGKITSDKSVSENRIVFQYEIFGCGSVVGKVIDGGEEITSKYKEKYPDIGVNEVVLSADSDEPRKHMDSAEFFIGGLAERYTYVIEGSPVGVTEGAPDCCELKPAYNEHVGEFKVDKWYLTSYVPYMEFGDIGVILCAFAVIFVSAVWLLLMMIIVFVKFIIKKKQKPIRCI